MTNNAETRQGQTGGSQEVLFAAGGENAASVARLSVIAQCRGYWLEPILSGDAA